MLYILLLTLILTDICGCDKSPSINTITISLNVQRYDQESGDLFGRIQLIFPLELLAKNETPLLSVTLIDKFTSNENTFTITKGKQILKIDSVYEAVYYEEIKYPFDQTIILLGFEIQEDITQLPVSFNCTCNVDNMSIRIISTDKSTRYYAEKQLVLTRAISVKVFALFTTLMFVIVAVMMIILTRRIIQSTQAPHMGTLGLIGALLFALPAVRSIQSLVPPFGIIIDYVGFYIAEFTCMIALLTGLAMWINRRPLTNLED
ncbi:unnamed protein product [Didymodactylos carnosus]|uniref:DUF4436 domain-containing protein n=1 Tax=Didymodactylos carnosus TaxID=1234261 RepID=A0A815CIW4_9BILA|nr:unnamed protein product [Didymodactylos carnosus]CAF1306201.1 unnamed protein product [Didymodactylos carnosus]CAF4091544.1 unnamed protein product [Didymodactylos carnosus]CAF4113397.1 unnamed protein product [Didymodactylos carnosus]